MRNRYYNPATGRFITEDPARSGGNWYSYCGGNPLKFVDPTGLAENDTYASIERAAMEASYGLVEQTRVTNEEKVAFIYQLGEDYTYKFVDNISDDKVNKFEVQFYKEGEETKKIDMPVGVVHTHVARTPEDKNDKFSSESNTNGQSEQNDLTFVQETGITLFLATPTGELKSLTPNVASLYNGKDSKINGNDICINDMPKLSPDPALVEYERIKGTEEYDKIKAESNGDLDLMNKLRQNTNK